MQPGAKQNTPPETPVGAHAFMRQILGNLDRVMRANGTAAMTAYLLLPNSEIVPVMLEDDLTDESKRGFANMLNLMATASAASCLAIAVEAWSLPRDVLIAEGMAGVERNRRNGISAHPNRIEVLSVLCQWPDAIVKVQAEIKRRGKAYDGHGEPEYVTVHPHQMRGRFSGIIRTVSVEERAAARELMSLVMPADAPAFLAIADRPAPIAN